MGRFAGNRLYIRGRGRVQPLIWEGQGSHPTAYISGAGVAVKRRLVYCYGHENIHISRADMGVSLLAHWNQHLKAEWFPDLFFSLVLSFIFDPILSKISISMHVNEVQDFPDC